MTRDLLLVGRIDAATTSMALFAWMNGAGEACIERSACVANDEYPGLRAILRRFAAADLPRLLAGCILLVERPPWPVEGDDLAAAIGLTELEVTPAKADAPTLVEAARRLAACLDRRGAHEPR